MTRRAAPPPGETRQGIRDLNTLRPAAPDGRPIIRVTPDGRIAAVVSVPYKGPADLTLAYRIAAAAVPMLATLAALDLKLLPTVKLGRGALAVYVTIWGDPDGMWPDGSVLRCAELAACEAVATPIVAGIEFTQASHRIEVRR